MVACEPHKLEVGGSSPSPAIRLTIFGGVEEKDWVPQYVSRIA